MKRKISKVFLLIAGLLMYSSCIKDIDPLVNNPYWIHGDFNPTLGVPLAYGEMNLADLLNMMKKQPNNFSITYDEGDDLITINYDSTFTNHITTGSKGSKSYSYIHKSRHKGSKDTSNAVDQLFPLDGAMPISIFEDVSTLPDSTQLKLQNVFLTLLCHISANLQENAVELIHHHNVSFYISRAKVTGINKEGDSMLIAELPDNIPLTALADGNTVNQYVFNKWDVASLINERPTQIAYSLALRVVIPNYTSVMPISQFIKDSLGINSFDINSDVKLEFPISGYINGLGYTTDLNMNIGNINTNDISIDTAQLVLELENKLPIELRMQGQLLDSNGNVLCTLFPNTNEDTIAAAKVSWNEASNSYVASQSTTRTHFITLNYSRFKSLQQCRKLRLSTYISTGYLSPSGRRLHGAIVTLRGSDKLKARAYLLAKPHYNFDTIISSNKNK
jgi:hypothetical protein